MDKEGYIVHFQHGKVYRVSPPIPPDADLRDYTYNARYIVSDGKRYDLEDRQSVLSIEIPDYLPPDASIESPTVYLEYILQRKCALKRKPQTSHHPAEQIESVDALCSNDLY